MVPSPVIGLGSSSSVYPTAINAAILAIGYPVALLANAEDLETLGLTSITRYSPVDCSTAN